MTTSFRKTGNVEKRGANLTDTKKKDKGIFEYVEIHGTEGGGGKVLNNRNDKKGT